MGASMVDRIILQQKYPHLNPRNLWMCILPGKSNFTELTKDFEMEILSEIIQMDPI